MAKYILLWLTAIAAALRLYHLSLQSAKRPILFLPNNF